MESDEVGGYHSRAGLGLLGEGGAGDLSACTVCGGASETGGVGWGGGGSCAVRWPTPP
jgi:hypothetical protein